MIKEILYYIYKILSKTICKMIYKMIYIILKYIEFNKINDITKPVNDNIIDKYEDL